VRTLKLLDGTFGIYKFESRAVAYRWVGGLLAKDDDFIGFSATATETAVICREDIAAPSVIAKKEGWAGFFFDGQLDFELVGILSRLTGLLADAGIGVLAVSTYDTDYVFIPSRQLATAQRVLSDRGYIVRG
jgi:hypothetical protein